MNTLYNIFDVNISTNREKTYENLCINLDPETRKKVIIIIFFFKIDQKKESLEIDTLRVSMMHLQMIQ